MSIQRDASHDALIVIPTVGDPAVLIHTVERIAAFRNGYNVALVIVLNPPVAERDRAISALQTCKQICKDGGIDILSCVEDVPIGFGAANNRGVMAALHSWGGIPDIVIFHNDDAHVTDGWLESMLKALSADHVNAYSDPWMPTDPRSKRQNRDRSLYGRVGIVGPLSNLVAGTQQCTAVVRPDGSQSVFTMNQVDQFAADVRRRFGGQIVTCDFISGFCVGLSRECMSDLMLKVQADADGASLVPCSPEDLESVFERDPMGGTTDEVVHQANHGLVVGPWDEETYRIAGYEDNDLCVRAEILGWRPVVAQECFIGHIGHQTFDRLFPEAQRGMRNRIAHYEKWSEYTSPDRPLHLGVVFRVKFEVGHDLHLFENALAAVARVADSVSVLLTNNPLDVTSDPAWPSESNMLSTSILKMLETCSGHPEQIVSQIFRGWVATVLASGPNTRFGSDPKAALPHVKVDVWKGPFNERAERNVTHEMAEDLGADWILSVDSDEIIENRINRTHFERWMRHPDPGVSSWDQGWINHWDSARLSREDRPWGDGGNYHGGMHGFRLWRIPRSADGSLISPRRIISGNPPNYLHCGNAPDHDAMGKRVSGLRFRHFGYVRARDRIRKHARYHLQDPNADPMLTGNGGGDAYGHLIGEEGMRITPFATHNGIGLHMLVHRGETADALARQLDILYGVVDRIVLVWTDRWDDPDKSWLLPADPEMLAEITESARAHNNWENIVNTLGPGTEHPPEPRVMRASFGGDPNAIYSGWSYVSGPTQEMAKVAEMFGASWVHEPLNDNLANARNAGLDALSVGAQKSGLVWSLFFDLDEHFPDPFSSVVAIRRMAEVTDSHGWMFQFLNFHAGSDPSMSQSVRMARLNHRIRFSGRVHETFDRSFAHLSDDGESVQVRTVSWPVHHYGLYGDDAALIKKLNRYQRMLELELLDDPHNSAAWVALALHFANDDREEKTLECLQRAVMCGGHGYLPFRELAMWHLRNGAAYLAEAMRRTQPGSALRHGLEPVLQILQQHVGPQPKLGRGPRGDGPPTCPDIELPPFSLPGGDLGGIPGLRMRDNTTSDLGAMTPGRQTSPAPETGSADAEDPSAK